MVDSGSSNPSPNLGGTLLFSLGRAIFCHPLSGAVFLLPAPGLETGRLSPRERSTGHSWVAEPRAVVRGSSGVGCGKLGSLRSRVQREAVGTSDRGHGLGVFVLGHPAWPEFTVIKLSRPATRAQRSGGSLWLRDRRSVALTRRGHQVAGPHFLCPTSHGCPSVSGVSRTRPGSGDGMASALVLGLSVVAEDLVPGFIPRADASLSSYLP